MTLTQQIFPGLALGIVAGAFVDRIHPEQAIYFGAVSQLSFG